MKKILALVLALVMCLGMLTACGQPDPAPSGDPKPSQGETPKPSESTPAPSENTNDKPLAGTYDITVWVAEEIVELTKSQITDFNNTNTDGIVINATVTAVGEGDAATTMTTDVEAGADIYCFPQDQTARLIQAGALAKLGASAQQTVTSANDAGVVSAAMSGEEMYAYPLTSDNGYFMYYDKRVISDDIVDSLEDLIAACENAGKMFSFEVEGSAWYTASFFFATGCSSVWTADDGGNFISVADDFNSDKGLIAVKGMEKLVKSSSFMNSSKGSDFEAATPSAIVVTGTWDYETVSGILGENMGVTDLPSFTVDGQSYHLGSFNGCKLMGVKPQTDAVRAAALHKLAQYLTNEECQMERFDAKGWGPANLNAQNSDAVKAAPHLAALFAQNAYSTPQGQIHGSWWDIAKVIATNVKNAADEAGLKAALETYNSAMNDLFNMSDDVKNAFTVIGDINGDTWAVDLAMTKQDDGSWKTDEAYTLNAGTQFKVRQGKSWDVAFGMKDDSGAHQNYVVAEAGTYYIVLTLSADGTDGTVTLVPAG